LTGSIKRRNRVKVVVLGLASTPMLDITGMDMIEELQPATVRDGHCIEAGQHVSTGEKYTGEAAGFEKRFGRSLERRTINSAGGMGIWRCREKRGFIKEVAMIDVGNYLISLLGWIELIANFISVLIIAGGIVVASVKVLQTVRRPDLKHYNQARLAFSRYLVLGLEFQLAAADIVRTAVKPSGPISASLRRLQGSDLPELLPAARDE
jgi:uncharacterized membrane protein